MACCNEPETKEASVAASLPVITLRHPTALEARTLATPGPRQTVYRDGSAAVQSSAGHKDTPQKTAPAATARAMIAR